MEEKEIAKQASVFKKEVVRKMYYFADYYSSNGRVCDTYNHVTWKDICKCTLDRPIMTEGEYIYLDEANEIVEIRKVARSTTNEVVYIVGDKETLDDEISKQSLEKAKAEMEEFLKSKREQPSVEVRTEEIVKRWYQFWK